MERGNGSDLLNRPVVTHGIELGRVVDVILAAEADRPLGLEVLCRDGFERFLPIAAARVSPDRVEVLSTWALLEPRELQFYRDRGRSLSGRTRQ
jgi:hypothetical protein